jgi:hypothetical protein
VEIGEVEEDRQVPAMVDRKCDKAGSAAKRKGKKASEASRRVGQACE